jgi:type VI secretion system FHA domain protein
VKLHVVLRQRGAGGKALQSADFDIDADNPLTFGRAAAQNRLHVPDDKRMVSNRHGRIELRGTEYYVVDLGSVNGTLLDGLSVQPEAPVGHGAVIAVGEFEIVVTLPERQGVGSGTASGAGPEQTLHSFDPAAEAVALWDALCARRTRERRATAGERRQRLASELRERLRRLLPVQARAVLKRLVARAGGAPAPAAAAPAEELLQAGLVQLQKLAQSLVPGQPLRQPPDVTSLCQQLDAYVRTTLTWLVLSLKGRAEFENEFGAEVTMVFQRSNNPLKGLEPTELAARLFDWRDSRRPGELKTQLEGILRDLTQHQLGLLGSVTEAIRSVTERLAPEAIETLAQKDAGLLTSKGAKAWEIYQKSYRDLLAEKSKLFHEVISPAIRKGYLMVHEDDRGRAPGPNRG